MLKIPLEEIITKIKEGKGLSEEEINTKIDEKMQQLSGLISKEGAAHIIANELGVKIFEQVSGKLQIKNIVAGMRSVETLGKVTKVFELREFKTETRTGKVSSMIIGDETGSIKITMWGDQAELIKQVTEGDIVKVIGGYVRENQGRKEVHMNDRSKLIVNPPGETVGEVAESQIQERPAPTRKKLNELAENDQNIEILGTIVQAFEPRFFTVCPSCGKKANQEGENWTCAEHGNVQPDFSYVMNVVLDDGTETIRTVFFRNQVERLLGKTKEEILKYRDAPETFEPLKTELLGNQVKLVGRTNKNQMFDRLEFTAQLVFTNPDPTEELNRMSSEKSEEKIESPKVEEKTEEPIKGSTEEQIEEKTEEQSVTQEVEQINKTN